TDGTVRSSRVSRQRRRCAWMRMDHLVVGRLGMGRGYATPPSALRQRGSRARTSLDTNEPDGPERAPVFRKIIRARCAPPPPLTGLNRFIHPRNGGSVMASHTKARRPGRVALRLERLEDRTVPSGDPLAAWLEPVEPAAPTNLCPQPDPGIYFDPQSGML